MPDRPQFPVLNLVIDVQDTYAELSPAAQAQRDAQFARQIGPLGTAEQAAHRERRSMFLLETPEQRDARLAFRQRIGEAVGLLRAEGVPSLFMSIGDSTELHLPVQPWSRQMPARRDAAFLSRVELSGIGPRVDEPVLQKRFMSGFVSSLADVRASPEREAYLTRQRFDGRDYAEAHFGPLGLGDYMQGCGVRHVTIMGGMTSYCITDNALENALRGYRVTVFPELITSRDTEWHSAPSHAATEGRKLAATLEEIVRDPAGRGYHAGDAQSLRDAAARIEQRSLTEHLDHLKANEPGVRQPFNRRAGLLGMLAPAGLALAAALVAPAKDAAAQPRQDTAHKPPAPP